MDYPATARMPECIIRVLLFMRVGKYFCILWQNLLLVESWRTERNNPGDTIEVWTTSHTVRGGKLTSRVFQWSPEGHFNHGLFDRLWQLFSIPGKRAITLIDEWGEKWEERKNCLLCLKMEAGVEKIVWVAGCYKIFAPVDQKRLHLQ